MITTKNRFKQEPYINQRKGKKGWTFQVRLRMNDSEIVKSFTEKDYQSARIAYESAVLYRNKLLYDIANNSVLKSNNLTVNDVFENYIETTTDSYNTKIKHQKLYNKYITTKNILIQITS